MRPFATLALLLACATRAGAQAAPATETGVHISPAIGVHYGSPMRLSAAAGVLVDMNGNRNDGVVVMAEVGQHGYEGAIGYFRMLGKFGSGYSLRAAALRTTDDPWNATAHTTYAGLEAHWMIAFGVGGRVGYLRRVSKENFGTHDNLASLGLSIGL